MEMCFNEKGRRIGQLHHRAKLTDHDVDLIFELRAQGLSLSQIACKMECGKTQVHYILSGERRGQAIARIRHVKMVS
ncbi:hypothetical protein CUZ56_01821 [Saezia sanguinis]|jgi:DNA invertase Pin-like site-specific DNA recombinase|uniref:Transposase IS30-like HTH domain-containing protein n=2 Tax=Saezia sanguinis TaxID=1965230 RepID=A0A433SCS5_9BURK|nr:hypothetical protein [Saezia sanguinis]RUS66541.1 hypothetical protein CUZ56_01821 [Saezia sanguinis]